MQPTQLQYKTRKLSLPSFLPSLFPSFLPRIISHNAPLTRSENHPATAIEAKAEVASVDQRADDDAHGKEKEYLEATDPRNSQRGAIGKENRFVVRLEYTIRPGAR